MRFAYDAIDLIRDCILLGSHDWEVGGLLFGDDEFVWTILPGRNIAPNPCSEFALHPQEMARALRNAEVRGEHLVGTFHSHPNGNSQMSSADAAMALQTGVLLIIGLASPWEWRLWDPAAGGEVELVIEPPRA